MGIKYICGNCGYVLYEFKRSCLGLLSPSVIAEMYKGKCPRCGKQLRVPLVHSWKETIVVKRCLKQSSYSL